MITKGASGYFRDIGLFKVLWKAVTSLLILRLTSAIKFHDSLQGFVMGRGTGTAALEANLLHQITAMREVVLFKVLLDLHKA